MELAECAEGNLRHLVPFGIDPFHEDEAGFLHILGEDASDVVRVPARAEVERLVPVVVDDREGSGVACPGDLDGPLDAGYGHDPGVRVVGPTGGCGPVGDPDAVRIGVPVVWDDLDGERLLVSGRTGV